jgi:hypothetical protein
MEVYLESGFKTNQQEGHVAPIARRRKSDIGTYSVGEGTDSMVKLSTICGNLSEHDRLFSLLENVNQKKREKDAYSAAKRMAMLAPVVSLAQTCAGGNQSAFEATNLATALFSTGRRGKFIYAHGMQTQGPPRPSTNPVSR